MALFHYSDIVIDSAGNAVPGASITIKLTGTNTLASVYSDSAGTFPVSNPLTADNYGRFSAYIAIGNYDIVITGSSILSYTQLNVPLGSVPVGANGQVLVTSGTTVAWQSKDFVDVRDYGAVFAGTGCTPATGIGCTDSGVALQAALDAGTGVTTFFPAMRTSRTQQCDFYSTITLRPKGRVLGTGAENANSVTLTNGTAVCFASGVSGFQIENNNSGPHVMESISIVGGDDMGVILADNTKFIIPNGESLPHFFRLIHTIQRSANVLTVTMTPDGGTEGLPQQVGSLIKINGVTDDATMNGVCQVSTLTASGGTLTNPYGFTCAQIGANSGPFTYSSNRTIYLSLPTTGPRASDGIRVCSGFTTLRDVHVQNFARFGVLADGTKGSITDHWGGTRWDDCPSGQAFADDYNFDHLSSWNSFQGVLAIGGDANAGTIQNNSTVYYNWNAAIEEQSDVGGYIAGNQVSYNGVTTVDTRGNATTTALASVARASSTVTATFSSAPVVPWKVGHCIVIGGVTDTSFNTPSGICYFISAVNSTTQVQYVQPGNPANASSSGGTGRLGKLGEVALASGADYYSGGTLQYRIGTSRTIYSGAFIGNYAEGGYCKYSQSSGFMVIAGPGTAPATCAPSADWQGNWWNGNRSNINVFWNAKAAAWQQFFRTGLTPNDSFEYDRLIGDSAGNVYWRETFDNSGGANAIAGKYSMSRGDNVKPRITFFGPNLAGGPTRIDAESGVYVEIGTSGNGDLGLKVGASKIVLDTPSGNVTAVGKGSFTTGVALGAIAFASLGTPVNGTVLYCNDCTVANPCAGSGTGALAKRLNGVWVCN